MADAEGIAGRPTAHRVLDVGDAGCEAVVEISLALQALAPGEVLEILSTDRTVEAELGPWTRLCGHQFQGCHLEAGVLRCRVRKGGN